jgi:ribosome biogenesis GTPase
VARGSRGGLSGDSRGQVLAANVDLALVAEPASPDTDLARIERLQALAWESGATPIVVLTKADLADDLPQLLADVAAAAPGAQVHAVSAINSEGIEAVRPDPGRTAVLLGPSGAGKSTLLNALAGAEVMVTQQVRAADGRGRHTTTHRELLLLPDGGLVIDTPGIRRVGLHDTGDGLAQAFSDLEEIAEGCRFADCAHDAEPGCAVQAAVASGELPQRRLDSWRKLGREAAWMASRTDARLRAEKTRQWKVMHKEMRKSGRNRP